MSPEVVDFFGKQLQQLGLPTVTLILVVYVLYKISIKIILPVAERLIQGHLTFLDSMKHISEKQAITLEAIHSELTNQRKTLDNIHANTARKRDNNE